MKSAEVSLAPIHVVLWAIYPLVFLTILESLSYGLLVPVLPIATTEYFAKKHNNGIPIDCVKFSNATACVQGSAEANLWSSATSSLGSLVSFILTPLMGQGSDIYGRKPFLVAAQVLHVVYPFTIMLFTVFNHNILVYFIVKFVYNSFLTGSVVAASVADTISPENRTTAYGGLFAIQSVFFSLAIALTEHFNTYMILLLSCGFYILRVLWCVFVYKETLSMSCRAPSYTGINPFRAMTILLKTSLFRRLSIVIALSTFVSAGLMSFRLYFFNTELGFNKNDNAAFLLVVGVASMLSQGLFLHPLIRFVRERGVVVISMASYAVMSGLYLVVLSTRSKVVVFIVAACSGFGDIGFAAISSLKSTHVSEQEQGRVQGALYAVRALASATGPLAYSALYSASQGGSVASESSPFILSLALYVVATGVSCLLSKSSSDRSDHRISAAALDVSVDSPHHGPMAPLLSSEDIEDDSGDI
ncbi:hypothetical protein H310_10371 [Aphanomyces invadans]|uniref:Major facilitator superfamily (MFS) profile domain-containing protein n=1 Tax=Aphanomyces invadans TaxID=157072 RepID=A0A024TRB5_9STRA|nr:hypothetical protein H310_10371 [Aphanomyces invadans]ETV96171.1 hypothetical protein H310_10371 [Aphanomyces invadans]|eukprot:XP_008874963.1 hypothetical protein H310_10371 [Aphanomyces invadans]